MTLQKILWVALTLLAAMSNAYAQQYLRIGTGGTAGTYYPIGTLVANLVTQPGKIVSTAHASNGSLGNVIGVTSGSLESGFSQADVATWAYNGTGIFTDKPRLSNLRLIANLYPESIHIVVRKGSGINTVPDLKGKRVALDEAGSGTLISARLVLKAYGLSETDLTPEYIKPNQAGNKLREGQLDAFFLTAGVPAKAIEDLAADGVDIALLPIDGAAADRLRAGSPFLLADTIAAGAYKGVQEAHTVAVGAQWITNEKVSADLIYQVTKALYTKSAQAALSKSHSKGKFITLKNAVQGAGIPFHIGAERFYKEAGVLN